LADSGLAMASVIANFHRRRIIPPVERGLRIYEMSDVTNPVSLARSWLLEELLTPGYAATRARSGINPKAVQHSDDDLWSFAMLPDAGQVSSITFHPSLPFPRICSDSCCLTTKGGHQRPQIGSADASIAGRRPRCTVAGAEPGGPSEGNEGQKVGAP
jgi:hypothetical protein